MIKTRYVFGATVVGLASLLLIATPSWAGTDTGRFETTDPSGGWHEVGASAEFRHGDNRFETCDEQSHGSSNDGKLAFGAVYQGVQLDGQAHIAPDKSIVGAIAFHWDRRSLVDGPQPCAVQTDSMHLVEGQTYTFEVCLASPDETQAEFCARRTAEA